jgi:hypothetical protein
MSLVPKNHWQLTKPRYERGILSGLYNKAWPNHLYVEPIENPTYEDLEPLMDKMSEKWGWKDQERYTEEALRDKLAQTGTTIYLLCDDTEPNDPVIGYALVSIVQKPLKDRFWSAANDVKVLEIDNLGLFPKKEGGGRGKAYFEMIFARHFADNDIVYWSQHETHAPTLTRFYREKMQMEHLARDHVPDWRKPVAQVA